MSYKLCKLTIDSTYVTATLSNFPVTLTEANFTGISDLFSSIKSDGGDIRFYTDEARTTQIAHEVGGVDTGTSKIELYVKVPSLSSSANTVIYMEYGDSAKSLEAVTSTYGRNAVWSQFDRVFHFNQDPSTTDLLDSTGSGIGGVASAESGYSWSASDLVDGTLKKAWDFGVKTDQKYVDIGTHAQFGSYDVSSPHYISAVAHVLNSGGDRMFYFAEGDNTNGSYLDGMLFQNKSYALLGGTYINDTTTYTADADIYHNQRWDTTNLTVSSVNTDIVSGAKSPTNGTAVNPLIGALWTTGSMTATTYWFGGTISELRISIQTSFSDDWTKTERNNLKNISSFASSVSIHLGSASLSSTSNTVTASATMLLSGGSAITSTSNTVAISGSVDRNGVASIASTSNTMTSVGHLDLSGVTSIASTSNTATASVTMLWNGIASISSVSNTLTAVAENFVLGASSILSASNTLECFDSIEYTMGVIGTYEYGVSSISSTTNDVTATASNDVFISSSIQSTSNSLSANGGFINSVYADASISSGSTTVECYDSIEYTMGSILSGIAFGSVEITGVSIAVSHDSIIYTMDDVRDIIFGTASISSTTNTLTATPFTTTVDKFATSEIISDTSALAVTATLDYSASASLTSSSFLIYIEGGAFALSNYRNPSGTITDYNWGSTFTGWNPQATITAPSNGATIT